MLRARVVNPPVALFQWRHQSTTASEKNKSEGKTAADVAAAKLSMHLHEDTTAPGSSSHSHVPTHSGSSPQLDEQTRRTLQRIQWDILRETDPLGGLHHRDYLRDPSRGNTPQYAPRNYTEGGRIDYYTPPTPLAAEISFERRRDFDHTTSRFQQEMARERAAIRDMSADEVDAYVTQRAKDIADESNSLKRRNESKAATDLFRQIVTPHTRANYMPDQVRIAQSRRERRLGAEEQERAAVAGVDAAAAMKHGETQAKDFRYSMYKEIFRNIHGLRAQERFEYEYSQRMARRPFFGQDLDRATAARRQQLFGQSSFDPLLPASTMKEAQVTVRENTVPSVEKLYAKEYYQNTLRENPKISHALTDSVLGLKRLTEQQQEAEQEKQRNEELGFGRQMPLSSDAGPDRRIQKLHKNDERLLRAHMWSTSAYSDSYNDRFMGKDPSNPYVRRDTHTGISSVIHNKFDVDRREAMHAAGKVDIAEQNTLYYGVPIKRQVDTFVRHRRNAKGERHTEYFTPFPSPASQRISQLYRDVEGFPLMRNRPEFLEYELLGRYRSHHQQRRTLALLHGLEPIPNETAQERDARRLKLDELCERTPFNSSLQNVYKGEVKVTAETLRQHFGHYFLPSPTAVTRMLVDGVLSVTPAAENGNDGGPSQPDTREHLLSGRYLNQLLTNSSYLFRIRSSVNELVGRMPEAQIEYTVPSTILSRFSEKEYNMYQRYVKRCTQKHEESWTQANRRRRWIADRGMYGTLQSGDITVQVLDATAVSDGSILTVPYNKYKDKIIAHKNSTKPLSITIEDQEYTLDLNSVRRTVPCTVALEDGSSMLMEQEDFFSCPLEEVEGQHDPNEALNYGTPQYHYNRNNYIETQDVIWEERTYSGAEGWTTATTTDGLRPGLAVQARRPLLNASGERVGGGEYQRAEVVQFHNQPFFNPNPRMITVRFIEDNTVQSVLLSDVLVWQLSSMGPDRTVPDETRKGSQPLKRYIDVADPHGVKSSLAPHFMDKYRGPTGEDPYRSVKQITDLDGWNPHDESRAENHRVLSISHRKDYVRQHYIPNYTPWDWIAIQEADAPLIKEQLRTENVKPSYLFEPNRYWRWKRRGYGYLQNTPNEVRDLLQYIDQVTPWKQAQKIRNLWEVRSHHPMPHFHRPALALHRNVPGLLPTHTWEVDKKTGRVKSLKDTVKDYQTLHPYPSWVQL